MIQVGGRYVVQFIEFGNSVQVCKVVAPLSGALKQAHPGLVTAPSALQHSSFPVCVGGRWVWGMGRVRAGGVEWGTRRAPPYPEPGSEARLSWQDMAFWQNAENLWRVQFFSGRHWNSWQQLEEAVGQDRGREQ